MNKIKPPTNCPTCGGDLTFKKDILYCLKDSCEAREQKSIQHWAKTLKIKGLGPQTIAKLNLTDITDIYTLTEDNLATALGSKLATKLLLEIKNSALAPMELMLPAFGIPLIGQTAAQKLKLAIPSIDELSVEKAKQAGLGPKAIESLMTWFNEYYSIYKEVLPFSWEFSNTTKIVDTNKVVCITGKLKSFKSKKEAEEALVNKGFSVVSSLTKKVNYLVNESGIDSAKTEKARESGVMIVTNINQLIGA